jgi:response regulator RpfG family c-di-GMP phosphodiesterase
VSALSKPQVLCVDDEPRIIDGLVLHLRKDYDVHTAANGEAALKQLRAMRGAAVVVSDMRMPGMNGATLLQQVRQSYPEATRILLTGEGGRAAAVLAVNQGQIFRFLTKPCPPAQLREAIEAGVIQNRLFQAERAVLQETVIGCIRALIDVLAIANPVAFGRARRVKRLVTEFAATLESSDFWQLEAAAMLSQIGYISLPTELVDKLYYGERLTGEEQTLAGGIPQVAINLLEHIPRLEPVTQILTALTWTDEQVRRLGEGTIGLATRILGLVLEYDVLIAQGSTVDLAIQSLLARRGRFSAQLIEQFAALVGAAATTSEVRELPLRQVHAGMTILQDVRTHLGTLLVPRGFEVTAAFLERAGNFGPEILAEPVRVLMPRLRVSTDPTYRPGGET